MIYFILHKLELCRPLSFGYLVETRRIRKNYENERISDQLAARTQQWQFRPKVLESIPPAEANSIYKLDTKLPT